MSKGINPQIVTTIIDAGFVITKHFIDAFTRGDEKEMEKLVDILPDPLKSRLALQLGEEKARKEFE